MKNNLRLYFSLVDIYTISILCIYIVLNIIYFNSLDLPIGKIGINLSIIVFIITTIYLDGNTDNKIISLLHRIYPAFFILFIYNQIQIYIDIINPTLFDDVFIAVDYAIFGVNPTEWFAQYSHPVLTEYLQIAYFSFYLLPVLHGAELLYNKKDDEYDRFLATILFTFYVSYLMYLIMPAIGPRFMLHDFFATDYELKGLFLTPYLRDIINSGGGIPDNAINPVLYVNRDCMPSGHTMITVVCMALVLKNKSKFRYLIVVLGISIIIATVYLRYHYVIDIIAGLILALPIIFLLPNLNRIIKGKKN